MLNNKHIYLTTHHSLLFNLSITCEHDENNDDGIVYSVVYFNIGGQRGGGGGGGFTL